MGHLFISYSHKDKAYAHKLQRHLLEKGFEAWIDDRIDFGARWPYEIEKRVRECDAFILVMSPNSHESEWVQNELMLARELKKRIFPLLLDGEAWWHVRTRQYVNVQGGKLPPASFLLGLAEAAPRGASQHAPAESEKPPADASPNINFYGDVSGQVIVGDGNRMQTARPGKGAPAKAAGDKKPPKIKTEIVVALIALAGTVITALAASPALLARMERTPDPPLTTTFAPSQTPALRLTDTPASSAPSLTPTLTFTPTDTPLPTMPTEITDTKGVLMRLVPAGIFTMGSNLQDNEKPIHTVMLPDYYMDVYEVTNTHYNACVEAGGCIRPKFASKFTDAAFADHPVVYVDWNQANIYCEWRGARLPTEAEWEKAARGTDSRTYPWGNNAPDKTLLNYNSNLGGTSLVGSYESGKSPYGMYDMAGNVWEWVADWYSDAYYDALDEDALDSQDLVSDSYRVLRGGAWSSYASNSRSAYRLKFRPDHWSLDIGFRCALSP